MNKAQKELRKFAEERMTSIMSIEEGGVRCSKDGTVKFRRGYFYTHGQTPETFAAKIREELARPEAPKGWEVVDKRDNYARWPKQSYFEVTVQQTGQ